MESEAVHPSTGGHREPVRRRVNASWIWTMSGALVGVAVYVAILISVFAQESHPDDPGDLRPLDFLLYAVAATPVLLIVAGLLTIRRRVRPVGLGLLLGVVIGLVGTMGGCYAML